MPRLDLYVIGTKSGNPADWSDWDELALVYAETPKHAQQIAEDNRPVHLVIPAPVVIYRGTEPQWGEDL